jgi:hypothetical protein
MHNASLEKRFPQSLLVTRTATQVHGQTARETCQVRILLRVLVRLSDGSNCSSIIKMSKTDAEDPESRTTIFGLGPKRILTAAERIREHVLSSVCLFTLCTVECKHASRNRSQPYTSRALSDRFEPESDRRGNMTANHLSSNNMHKNSSPSNATSSPAYQSAQFETKPELTNESERND